MLLRRLRRTRGLSQRALVRSLHLNSHSAIVDYEAGRRIPPADVLRGYEQLFGLAAGELARQRDLVLADRAMRESLPAPAPEGGESAIPRQLPLVPTCFTGRDDAFARLDQVLLGPAAPGVVAVSGMGGVGKTALALWWGHHRAALFPGGTLYVNLRGFDPAADPLEPAVALEGFLRALGVPTGQLPFEAAGRAALFRSLTAARRVLVVLDNARNADQARSLLPGTGAARAIVTSRDRLAGLTAREGVTPLPLDVLSAPSALELLAAVSGQGAPAQAVPGRAAPGRGGPGRGVPGRGVPGELMGQVARFCGGLPLALRVAGERIARDPSAGLSRVLAELSDPCGRLRVLQAGEDEASAVHHVLSWSYGALPAAAQRTLILLGSANIPDADTLAASALTGQDPAATGHQLELLSSGHLLLAGAGRHSLHDLVRCFTRDVAARETSQEDRDAAVARLIAWHLHSACNARLALAPQLPPLRASLPAPAQPASFGSADEALAWCEAERGNLVAVTQLAFDHGLYDAAWQLPTAWYGFLELRKHWDDWVQTHTIALKAAEQLADDEAQGRIWCNLGNAYRPRYQFDATIDCYRNALALFKAVGYRQGEAKVLGNLGTTLHEMGTIGESIEQHELALAIFRELGDRYGTALTLTNLGDTYLADDLPDRAMAAHREALALFRDARDLDGQGRTLSNMGKTLAVTGQHARAEERHQQALLFFQSAGNLLDYAYTQADLMAARFARADPEAAVFHGQQAANLLAELGHHASSGQVLADLAVVYRSAGNQARARACLRQSAVASAKASTAQREAALRLRTPLADPAKGPND